MQVIKFGEFLNPRMYTQIHTSTVVQGRGFLVPRRLSLGENVRAKEGGKKTNCETSLRMPFFTLPMVPCGSLPIARNYLAKNEAPEEEADGGGGFLVVDGTPARSFCHVAVFRNDFTLSGKPLIFLTR